MRSGKTKAAVDLLFGASVLLCLLGIGAGLPRAGVAGELDAVFGPTAPDEIPGTGLPSLRACFATKQSTSSEMSSGRSRNGGTWISMTTNR